MTRFDLSLVAAPAGLAVALSLLVWRRWVLPLLVGIVGVPLGGVVGRLAWEWLANRPPGLDFNDDFAGLDWVIGFASVGTLVGVLTGTVLSARRARRRFASADRRR